MNKFIPMTLPLSAVLALGATQTASADEVNLDFDLSPYQPTRKIGAKAKQTAKPNSTKVAIAAQPKIPSNAPPFQTNQAAAATPTVLENAPELKPLFQGGVDSLVAKAVGTAEGTRTPTGDKTWAYYGHVDPGNGVWNQGTFSYQHQAISPEAADDQQLRRLASQAVLLKQQAIAKGIDLTLEETLNGIDLANQAPLAALDRGGYIDWLQEAQRLGLRGSEAILWARTRSFLDPDTQQWNAPGLGNNVHSISRDQERRLQAVARVVELHQSPPSETIAQLRPTPPALRSSAASLPDTFPANPEATSPLTQKDIAFPAAVQKREAIADVIISLDLPPTSTTVASANP